MKAFKKAAEQAKNKVNKVADKITDSKASREADVQHQLNSRKANLPTIDTHLQETQGVYKATAARVAGLRTAGLAAGEMQPISAQVAQLNTLIEKQDKGDEGFRKLYSMAHDANNILENYCQRRSDVSLETARNAGDFDDLRKKADALRLLFNALNSSILLASIKLEGELKARNEAAAVNDEEDTDNTTNANAAESDVKQSKDASATGSSTVEDEDFEEVNAEEQEASQAQAEADAQELAQAEAEARTAEARLAAVKLKQQQQAKSGSGSSVPAFDASKSSASSSAQSSTASTSSTNSSQPGR